MIFYARMWCDVVQCNGLGYGQGGRHNLIQYEVCYKSSHTSSENTGSSTNRSNVLSC